MQIIRNPAKARPLSKNVKRLMVMARETPANPNVQFIERPFTDREETFCAYQAEIFVKGLEKGYSLKDFSSLYMTSQLAGVIDFYFFRPEERGRSASIVGDSFSVISDGEVLNNINIPVLMESPEMIVNILYEIDHIMAGLANGEDAVKTFLNAQNKNGVFGGSPLDVPENPVDHQEEEYAYWLGYIYRCECLMHEESSRMVFGAFPEEFMREAYKTLSHDTAHALEICRELDRRLVGNMKL